MHNIRTHLAAAVIAVSATLVAGLTSSPAVAEQSLAEAGKRDYIRRCAACHELSAEAPANLGPHLEGIVGRLAGGIEDFEYSEEVLLSQSFHWDEETLDEWLKTPQQMIPDMCMPFFGLPRAEHRERLIAFLKNPVP